jgi:hypothetical protein
MARGAAVAHAGAQAHEQPAHSRARDLQCVWCVVCGGGCVCVCGGGGAACTTSAAERAGRCGPQATSRPACACMPWRPLATRAP